MAGKAQGKEHLQRSHVAQSIVPLFMTVLSTDNFFYISSKSAYFNEHLYLLNTKQYSITQVFFYKKECHSVAYIAPTIT